MMPVCEKRLRHALSRCHPLPGPLLWVTKEQWIPWFGHYFMQRVINETIRFFPSLRAHFEPNKQPKGLLFNCTWVMDIIKMWRQSLYETWLWVTVCCSDSVHVFKDCIVDWQRDYQTRQRSSVAEMKVAHDQNRRAQQHNLQPAVMKLKGSTGTSVFLFSFPLSKRFIDVVMMWHANAHTLLGAVSLNDNEKAVWHILESPKSSFTLHSLYCCHFEPTKGLCENYAEGFEKRESALFDSICWREKYNFWRTIKGAGGGVRSGFVFLNITVRQPVLFPW